MRNLGNGLRVWTICALIAIGTMTALVPGGPAAGGPGCQTDADCGCTAEQQMQGCSPESGAGGTCIMPSCACNAGFSGQFCENATGACCFVDFGAATDGGTGAAINLPPRSCQVTTVVACEEGVAGEYLGNGTDCDPDPCNTPTQTPTATPTGTPTQTPTATPTSTPFAPGAECELTSDCAGGLTCADGFCCNEACDGPDEACGLPGLEGICTVRPPAGAPAASHQTIVVIVALLAAIGGFGVFRQRRQRQL